VLLSFIFLESIYGIREETFIVAFLFERVVGLISKLSKKEVRKSKSFIV